MGRREREYTEVERARENEGKKESLETERIDKLRRE